MMIMSDRVIARCFALAAFAVACLAGLASGNSTAQVLIRAIVAAVVCSPVGVAVGLACAQVISLHMRARNQVSRLSAEAPSTTPAPSARDDEDVIAV